MGALISSLGGLLLIALAIVVGVLLLIFVVVPLLKGIGWMITAIFKGIGWMITAIFKGIGWLIAHVFQFIAGMIGDTLRFVGAIIAMIVLVPLTLLNVLIGRWSAAGHFAESIKRECKVAGLCLYRVALQRPLKFVLLHSLLEGVEQRVPEAMAAAPTSDKPSKRTGQFPGYAIVGSLKGGGSGAKLYVAQPDDAVMARYPGMPQRVVIKSFALTEGSSLPQIVRESRALECAKQLGLVFEHGMDERRFYYVMPFHAGDHLGIVTRQLHAESGGRGLGKRQLVTALGYTGDLVRTLSTYHRGGLWHKDVKPENIIVHSGGAHLVDLGLVTPLRSAMTLTTHGTEYFRDPEMVRQALRGVKVHQVNGAKFDIFAAGAVLYFMIENDFPPHGALSRFTRNSPDAIKWIVRRAMADYNHRYESADDMLADVRFVAAAGDPFAVKPAELPSMQGGAVADWIEEEDLAVETVAHAGSPVPPPEAQETPQPEIGGAGVYVGPAGMPPAAARPADPGRRPRLQVTNWWTGAYRVTDPGSPGGSPPAAVPGPEQIRMAREQAAALRQQAAVLRHKVRSGAMDARRAAREQLRSARARAKEIQKRAHKHRQRAVAERQPSLMLIGLVATVVAAFAAVAGFTLMRSSSRSPAIGPRVTIESSDDDYAISISGDEASVIAPRNDRRPVLLVPSVKDPDDKRIAGKLKRIIDKYDDEGYHVVVNQDLVDGGLEDLLKEWVVNKDDRAVDKALEDELEAYSLYGLVHVTERKRSGRTVDLDDNIIRSTRAGAESRRFHEVIVPGPIPDLPILLVNDHPTKHDPEVAEEIARQVDLFRKVGFEVVSEVEMEVAVRKAMPANLIKGDWPMPEVLQITLGKSGLSGILYVYATPGDAPAAKRIGVSLMMVDPENPNAPPADPGRERAASPGKVRLCIGGAQFAVSSITMQLTRVD